MEEIDILAIQIGSFIGNKQENFKKVSDILDEKYKELSKKPDIVILPELWAIGWACEEFVKNAEKINDSITLKFLSELAIKYNTNILGGSFVRQTEENNIVKYYNTCPVIDRKGNLIATYDKNHLFSYYDDCENKYITEGKNPVIVDVEGVKIGLTICYDIRFPEIYRAYRKYGADLLVNMAAWPLSRKIHWDSLTCARAVENQTYMVALTQTGDLPTGAKNLGHSLIYNYSGEILDEISTVEGGISATINLSEMYEFRNKCTILKDIHKDYEVLLK